MCDGECNLVTWTESNGYSESANVEFRLMTIHILQLMVLCEPVLAACVSFVTLEYIFYFERPSRMNYSGCGVLALRYVPMSQLTLRFVFRHI